MIEKSSINLVGYNQFSSNFKRAIYFLKDFVCIRNMVENGIHGDNVEIIIRKIHCFRIVFFKFQTAISFTFKATPTVIQHFLRDVGKNKNISLFKISANMV